VSIVNESFAAKFWPGEEPLGKHLRLFRENVPQPWLTVVGVAPDILQNFRRLLEHDALIYLPYRAQPQRQVFLMARTRVPPGTLAQAVRHEVQQVDENLRVYEVYTLENRIAQKRLTVTVFGTMCAVFALVALVLASIGLHSVIAHSVSERTQEIGIRMAMGGSSRDILRLVFAQGMRPLGLGLALGLAAALAVTRVLGALLAGVSAADPVTFLAVVRSA
jgi:putative ABC transport system permease protein